MAAARKCLGGHEIHCAIGVAIVALSACGVERELGAPEIASGPPSIVVQPKAVTIEECGSAEFIVEAIGPGPLQYRWFRDGTPIPEANLARYAIPRAGLRSNGSAYSVRVENAGGSVLSDSARLSVVSGPGPIQLARGPALGIGASGVDLVWADGARIYAASVDCNSPQRVIYERRSPIENTDALAVIANRVVWTDQAGGAIRSVNVEGDSLSTLASQLGAGAIQSLAIGAGRAYWANLIGGIQTVDLGGGGLTTFPVGPPPFAVNAIAADERYVYWANTGDQSVRRMDVGGGPVTVVASAQGQIGDVVVSGRSVYWTSTESTEGTQLLGSIRTVNKDGGEVIVLAEQSLPALKIAVDSSSVFWTSGSVDFSAAPSTGFLSMAPLDASRPPTVLAAGLDAPFHIQVDDHGVYWTDRRGIMGLRKQVILANQAE